MKVTDLRIGNYVWDDYSGEMIIFALSANNKTGFKEISLKKDKKLPSGLYFIKDIKPIPLTEQWLKDFGFKKIDHIKDGVIYINSYLTINTNFGCVWRGGLIGQIKYIHSLQNLYFALTNTELIKL